MKKVWVMGAALAAASAVFADEPLDAARAYYGWALGHAARGLPTPAERKEMARFIAPELLRLFSDASQIEKRCVKAALKGEKPLIVEGDVLVANYEGATEVAYGLVAQQAESASMDANLVYIDRRFAKSHPQRVVAWQDRLDFIRAGDRWLVKDAHFPPDRSLAEELRGYIDDGERSCGPQ